tara:strand:+ start:198 stop:938 length:741 start_codon:yes stop_codon:yes gene_type:complete
MAEVFTSDNSVPTEVMESQEADIADSLRVGEELEAAHEQRLAGKYNSTEELEAAYLELQKKLGSQNGEQEDVQAELEETFEVDWLAEAYNSINESGELSEELVQQISEMNGMDVFNAMQGQQPVGRDLSESEMSSVYQAVGGQDQYGNLISWAQENFSEAEINAYDSVIESGDIAQINLALQALYYRYTDAMGQEGELLQGKPAASQSTFRSQQELIQAMNDPRYDNDPAYRQDVLSKLDRSDISF